MKYLVAFLIGFLTKLTEQEPKQEVIELPNLSFQTNAWVVYHVIQSADDSWSAEALLSFTDPLEIGKPKGVFIPLMFRGNTAEEVFQMLKDTGPFFSSTSSMVIVIDKLGSSVKSMSLIEPEALPPPTEIKMTHEGNDTIN